MNTRKAPLGMTTLAFAGLLVAACSDTSATEGDLDAESDAGTRTQKRSTSAAADAAAPLEAATDAGTSTTTADPDAGSGDDAAQEEATPCGTTGASVYAFVDGAGTYYYATSPETPSGFSPGGLAFKLAPERSSFPRVPLYLLRSGRYADYLISKLATEGAADGYETIAQLGSVYETELPGTVPHTRYYQVEPRLRHRVSIDGPVSGWDPEPPRGYVCPR